MDHDKKRGSVVIAEVFRKLIHGSDNIYDFPIQNVNNFNIEELNKIEGRFSSKSRYTSHPLRFIFTTADMCSLDNELRQGAGIEFAMQLSEKKGTNGFHPKLKIVLLDKEKPLNMPDGLFDRVIINNPDGYNERHKQERMHQELWQQMYHPWTDLIVNYILQNRIAK